MFFFFLSTTHRLCVCDRLYRGFYQVYLVWFFNQLCKVLCRRNSVGPLSTAKGQTSTWIWKPKKYISVDPALLPFTSKWPSLLRDPRRKFRPGKVDEKCVGGADRRLCSLAVIQWRRKKKKTFFESQRRIPWAALEANRGSALCSKC